MKTFRSKKGPFTEQPYYTDTEIEAICQDELQKVGLLPASPEPVRIDRFIEKRFGVTHSYDDLGEDVLGLTVFGSKGVQAVIVSRVLEEEGTIPAERRVRSTLAHEAGHGLLHAHLFVLEQRSKPLFGDHSDPAKPKVLCRDIPVEKSGSPYKYRGEWWEFHANRAIGSLLLPRTVVDVALSPFLVNAGTFGARSLDFSIKDAAVAELARIFNVNPVVARIRIDGLYPQANARQLTL
jgi:hypothetical protein